MKSEDSVVKRTQLNHQYTFFSECVAMADTRLGLFNDPHPSQLVGRMSLCQVSELVFVDKICDLIDIDQYYSNVSLKGISITLVVPVLGNSLKKATSFKCILKSK